MMNYLTHINDNQEKIINRMLHDASYWAGGHPPHSPSQLITWAVEDMIDSYVTGKESGRLVSNSNR